MAVTYPLRGANATINSWGSTNFYSNLKTNITPASMAFNVQNNGVNVTGIGEFPISEIPGLISADATIGGFAGASPYLGVYASSSASGGTTAPYMVDIQSLNLTLRCLGVDDITTGSSGSPATYMSFMPVGGFQATATWTALVDQNTPLLLPDIRTNTLNNIVFTYGNGQTLTFATGNIRTLGVRIARNSKQIVTYQANSVGAVTPAGINSLLGTTAFDSSNPFPLWSGPAGSTQGALTAYMHSTPRSIAFADSFVTAISISATPGAPVGVECQVQASGAITLV